MVETVRTVAELLTDFAEGQAEGSITSQRVRNFIVSASVLDTVKIIKVEADFPAPILAPDGNMRIPLDISIDYVFDVDQIAITTPFLMPARLLGFERVRFQSHTNTTMNYTGTIPLFWGRNQGPFETDKVDYVGLSVNEIAFDMVAADGNVPLTIFNTAFVNMDMGRVEGFAISGNRVGLFDLRGPLLAHNLTTCLIEASVLSTPTPSSDFPVGIILTGGFSTSVIAFNNIVVAPITGLQSYFAVDSGAVFNQTSFIDIPFDGTGGSFFELDLTGSITQFQDLEFLIDDIVTNYENDGNGNVLVTTSEDHDVYVGLTVEHGGAGIYDGQHLVIRVPGNNQYVMDAAYISDVTSGLSVGVGTRVTTTVAHKLTEHRTTDITGTTNYNATGLEVLNPASPTFDIGTPFVADDGTGTYLTRSLDQTDIKMLAINNGALPNSKKVGAVNLIIPTGDIVGSGAGPVAIGGVNWTPQQLEKFTSTVSGDLMYIDLNPAAVLVQGTATVTKTGSTQTLALSIAKNGVSIPASEGVTSNSTPTQVSSFSVLDLVFGDIVSLFVENKTNADNMIVNQATLIATSVLF